MLVIKITHLALHNFKKSFMRRLILLSLASGERDLVVPINKPMKIIEIVILINTGS